MLKRPEVSWYFISKHSEPVSTKSSVVVSSVGASVVVVVFVVVVVIVVVVVGSVVVMIISVRGVGSTVVGLPDPLTCPPAPHSPIYAISSITK